MLECLRGETSHRKFRAIEKFRVIRLMSFNGMQPKEVFHSRESFKHSFPTLHSRSWARKKSFQDPARKKPKKGKRKVFKTTTKFFSFSHSLFRLWIKIYDSEMRFSPCVSVVLIAGEEKTYISTRNKSRKDRKAIKRKKLIFPVFVLQFSSRFPSFRRKTNSSCALIIIFLIELCFPISCFLDGKVFLSSLCYLREKSVSSKV